ncbi:MAG: ATP-grasp domain-containing protein [Candidatus Gracilibacteria bacterium]|nr:ATP-grasp domain-containing protein [Candidatus Gracilibacteria bacterium]
MKIAILSGGTGLERDVALRSAKTFKDNIRYDNDLYILPEQLDDFLASYKSYDLAIPVFHGKYGEDGIIFGLLESLSIKAAFSPMKTHAICMDKNMTNILVNEIGIKIPKSYILKDIYDIADIDITYPAIVKPNSGGSSIATYKTENITELEDAVKNVFELTEDFALVQEFIIGTEYSVPIIGNAETEILPIMRVQLKSGDFFDHDEKYNSDGSNEIFGDTDKDLEFSLKQKTKDIYRFLGCRGISRIDYMVNESGIYFLEVNTIPGFSAASIFPKAWKLSGRDLPELIDLIISLGLEDNK